MRPTKAKTIAAEILKTAKDKIWINPNEVKKTKEAITREDIRALIIDGTIKKQLTQSQSRGRARILKTKKAKGRKKGHGKRTGTKKTRTEKKKKWVNKVRSQRKKLKELRTTNTEAVETIGYQKLYKMVKGNYFRGKKYLEKYVKEHK